MTRWWLGSFSSTSDHHISQTSVITENGLSFALWRILAQERNSETPQGGRNSDSVTQANLLWKKKSSSHKVIQVRFVTHKQFHTTDKTQNPGKLPEVIWFGWQSQAQKVITVLCSYRWEEPLKANSATSSNCQGILSVSFLLLSPIVIALERTPNYISLWIVCAYSVQSLGRKTKPNKSLI